MWCEKQEQEPTKKEEALEKLEEANIEPEKQEEAEAVKEDLKRRS